MSLDNLFGLCGRANPDGVGCVRHQGHLRACLYSTERTHRSPSQPAEISQGGRPSFSHVAKCKICNCSWGVNDSVSHCVGFKHPADGRQFIEVKPWDQYFAELDAKARSAAFDEVQTQPPPSHPAPKDSQLQEALRNLLAEIDENFDVSEGTLAAARKALATPEVRHAPTEGQQGNSDQFRDVTDMVDKHGNPEGNINGGELPPEPVVRVHDVEVEPWDIRYYSVPEVDAYIAALRSAAVSASPIPVAPLDSGLRELLVEAVRLVREYENHRCGRNNCWPDFYKVSTWLQRYKAQTTAVPAEKEDSHA